MARTNPLHVDRVSVNGACFEAMAWLLRLTVVNCVETKSVNEISMRDEEKKNHIEAELIKSWRCHGKSQKNQMNKEKCRLKIIRIFGATSIAQGFVIISHDIGVHKKVVRSEQMPLNRF